MPFIAYWMRLQLHLVSGLQDLNALGGEIKYTAKEEEEEEEEEQDNRAAVFSV